MDKVLPSQQKRANSYIAKRRVAWLVEFLFEHLLAVKFFYAVITSSLSRPWADASCWRDTASPPPSLPRESSPRGWHCHHRSSSYHDGSDVGRLQLRPRGRGESTSEVPYYVHFLWGERKKRGSLRLLAEIDVVKIHGIRATVPFLDGCHILRRC
jgi:hypothetical protein